MLSRSSFEVTTQKGSISRGTAENDVAFPETFARGGRSTPGKRVENGQCPSSSPWQCRQCAGWRYARVGGALGLPSRVDPLREMEVRLSAESGQTRLERSEPWYPDVVSAPA
jgi:hypothetical protein